MCFYPSQILINMAKECVSSGKRENDVGKAVKEQEKLEISCYDYFLSLSEKDLAGNSMTVFLSFFFSADG